MTQSDKGKKSGDAAAKTGGTAEERAAERAARQAANRLEREARKAARQAERAAAKPEQPAPPHTRPQTPQPQFMALSEAPAGSAAPRFNILIVAQDGRLARQAVLFAASLRRNAPDWQGRLIVAEPLAEAAWAGSDTRLDDASRAALAHFGAEIIPFTARHFGSAYPYGNKIEALAVLPPAQPFVFFDSDTLVTGPLDRVAFDFTRPAASMRRGATWPEPPPYGPGYSAIWQSLYDRFGLDFPSSLDLSQYDEHWERYLYFNAGWFFAADPQEFGRRFLEWALVVRDDPGEALAAQSLDPWLDQVVLPLVIHSLGGGRPGPALAGLDGDVTCHYRNFSLLYAREPAAAVALVEDLLRDPQIAPLFAEDEAALRLVWGGEGRDSIRPMFPDAADLPEQPIRHRLKQAGLWLR